MTTETTEQRPDGAYAGYAAPEQRPPFGSYAVLTVLFNAALAAGMAGIKRSGRELPERVDGRDILLTGVATHKLSRLISKDKITAFARAPFTEYQHPGGPAEVEERPRGEGWKRTMGELLVVAPRSTRFATSVLTGLTISDFLQIAYKAAEDRGLGGS